MHYFYIGRIGYMSVLWIFNSRHTHLGYYRRRRLALKGELKRGSSI